MKSGKSLNHYCLLILPTKKQTRPSNWTKRELLDGIFYQLKNGCNWQDLPKDLLPYSTVYWHLHSVALKRGNWSINEPLAWTSAPTSQKKALWTTLIIIDSQAVQNTCNASVDFFGVLLLQSDKWDQTASGSRYVRISLLHTLKERQCFRWCGTARNVDTQHWLLPVEAGWTFPRSQSC